MTPARHGPPGAPRPPGRVTAGRAGVRAWPVWKLPRWLIGFVTVVVAADAAGITLAAARPFGGSRSFGGLADLGLFGLLVACDVGGVELTRRAGEKTGVSRDMHGVWELPIAILLPVGYAPLSPIIRIALTQWRVRRGSPHRRVFSAAALGLSYLAASVIFHRMAGGTAGGTEALDPLRPGIAWMLCAALAGLAQRLVNAVLVLTAVKGSDRAIRLRDVQFGHEPLYSDMAELCLAVLVSVGVATSPIALLFAFPFVSLLLRTVRHAQLANDSRTDSKTGLLNAGTWQRDAAAALARAVRQRQPVAVAVLDLDWFKLVNDTYGHLFGDEVLRQIGQCLPTALRDYDLAGRFGGEEFVLLLPYTQPDYAYRVAERVRSRIAGLPLRAPDGTCVQVTASVGVTALTEGGRYELNDLLATADAAMYRAKRGGRNRVQVLSPGRGGATDDGLGAGGLVTLHALARDALPVQPGSPEAIARTGGLVPPPAELTPAEEAAAARRPAGDPPARRRSLLAS